MRNGECGIPRRPALRAAGASLGPDGYSVPYGSSIVKEHRLFMGGGGGQTSHDLNDARDMNALIEGRPQTDFTDAH